MTNQKQIRAAFWESFPHFEEQAREAGSIPGPMQDSFKRSASDARAAIAKARGEA